MADSISEIATAEQGNRLEIAVIQAKAKTERSIEKEHIKHKMNLEMERTRLEHHQQKVNAPSQCAHEVSDCINLPLLGIQVCKQLLLQLLSFKISF